MQKIDFRKLLGFETVATSADLELQDAQRIAGKVSSSCQPKR
jgi:hypothetical protein